MLMYLAHAGGEHTEPGISVWSRIMHQPTWLGLLIVAATLAIAYLFIAKALKLNFGNRLLVIVSLSIVLGALYLPHNPTVTGIVLSAGFITAFLLTFTLLGKAGK